MLKMDKIRINLYDVLACISNTEGLVSSKLSNHHQQVAYLAFRLSEQLGLPREQQYEIFIAALIHDIGALSTREKLELIETEPLNINDHAFRGAKLLEGFKPLQGAAQIIKYHHVPWDYGNGKNHMGMDVPLASHIIHISDRTCTSINLERNVLSQMPEILAKIQSKANSVFREDLVEALTELGKKEYIWLDLALPAPAKKIIQMGVFNILTLDVDDIVDLSKIFSHIIDFRSRFTARHSAGVAKTAQRLAELAGFSPYECKMMLIAGYLHDLGKIAINDEVLEKPSKLSEDEFNEIRSHTYYTYQLLEPIEELKIINTWASFHHEKLNGKGYPFHISGDSLSLGARIMAVADIFTATTEDRPYRAGMDFESVRKILSGMVENGAIDGRIVDLLVQNYEELNSIRDKSQKEAAEQYQKFLNSAEIK